MENETKASNPTLSLGDKGGQPRTFLVETLLGLFDFENFLALVVAALGAGTMGHLALVTVRAFGERVRREMVMGAP